ncbi:MAG: glycosyltransferase family 2 protein, partial [Phycisphaerales bacterium]
MGGAPTLLGFAPFRATCVPMVAAIIVNFNAGPLLTDSVAAVLPQAAHVVVVDNASSDGSIEALEHRLGRDARLSIVRRASNGGFSVGCNDGIRLLRSRADWATFGAVLI